MLRIEGRAETKVVKIIVTWVYEWGQTTVAGQTRAYPKWGGGETGAYPKTDIPQLGAYPKTGLVQTGAYHKTPKTCTRVHEQPETS